MSFLKVEDLSISFRHQDSWLNAVDQINFEINEGKTLCIIGESGSGKSVTALSVIKLLDKSARIQGRISLADKSLSDATDSEMRRIRGKDVAMIFQEPMTSLNPVMTIGNQISEVISLHQKVNREDAKRRAIEILKKVGVTDCEDRFDSYPHELSGGLRQRIMICIALACRPRLLIADEPTTALDVTIQAQILQLLRDLQHEMKMALMLITHDFGVVAEMADSVAVMYAGKIVEYGTVSNLFNNPQHPYTIGLQKSIPAFQDHTQPLYSIPGTVPPMRSIGSGCRFSSRCPFADEKCRTTQPPLTLQNGGQAVACFYPQQKGALL